MAFDGVIRGMAVAAALVVAAWASAGCDGRSSRVTPRGGTGGKPGAPSGGATAWGAPVLAAAFGGTALDMRKWQVYEAPDASTPRGVAAGPPVTGGHLDLGGGLFGGRDQVAGAISRLAQTYGRWEARFRADPGNGYSATAFLWPVHMGDPEYAEIDFAGVLAGGRRGGGRFSH